MSQPVERNPIVCLERELAAVEATATLEQALLLDRAERLLRKVNEEIDAMQRAVDTMGEGVWR